MAAARRPIANGRPSDDGPAAASVAEGQLGPLGASPGGFAPPAQLGSEVATYVRELILAGGVRPGEFLRIDGLATTLGISATPVREGLLSLRGEGFVAFEPRRGFRVAPLSPSDLADLYWAQAELAAELARRTALAAEPGLVAELEAIDRRMRDAVGVPDLGRVEAANHDFHRRINRAAGAPKLTWLLRSVVRYAPRRFYPRIPGWADASVADHAAILDAIRSADGDRAAATMRGHIRHAGDLLRANLRLAAERS
jgi:DNA-binding GntR family transcriptional regulator